MKIGLELNNKAIKEYTPVNSPVKASAAAKANAAKIDIKGSILDTNAYAKHGKTGDELMMEAGAIDVTTTRNMMIVASNTMSEEDYKKAMEGGFDPSEMSYEDTVTILDHIKAAIAEAGQVIEGYNDDLSDDVLKEVTGRSMDLDTIKEAMEKADIPATPDNIKKLSEAIQMMADIVTLPEGSVKYMVENELEPTIGNIYTARFSAMDDGSHQARGYYAEEMSGYYARKADNVDWEAIKPQVEKAVESMDLPDTDMDKRLEDAKWLMEKGIPVTEAKMTALEDVESIEFPVAPELVIEAGIEAITEGKEPKDGNLSNNGNNKNLYRKAFEQREALINASIDREEARLTMSIDANIRLLKKGISIDTKPVEEVLEALKKEEENLRNAFLGESDSVEEADSKVKLYNQTVKVVEEIPTLPAATLGRVVATEGDITLAKVHESGVDLKNQYQNASLRYEEMGTEVRKDLGDSITKAFRNVDDILRDLRLPVTAENERAVRILGYNSMIINAEEIKKVADVDSKLQNAIRGLTPAKTLQLIREGINPLGLNIDELVDHVNEMDMDPKRDNQKYSKFLYKLEQSKGITDEEKQSFIGIYRMINRLEKTDHASIGRLLDSGADITFGNLLTAMRSARKSFNLKIDDDFGLLEETISRGSSITDQIEAAFVNKVSEEVSKELDDKYAARQMAEIRESAEASEEIVEELLNNNVKVSPENIQAAIQFEMEPNRLFRHLRAYSRRVDNRTTELHAEDKLTKAIDEFPESLTGVASAKEGYKSLIDTMTETLSDMADIGADTSIDLASIGLMYKQLSLAVNYSNEENYHVPVMVEGKLTDINLKLQHGEETGIVTATMEIGDSDSVGAQIRVNGNSVEAIFIGENRESVSALNGAAEIFRGLLRTQGFEEPEIRFITGNPKASGKIIGKNADNNNEAVTTGRLYAVAKSFIQSVNKVN